MAGLEERLDKMELAIRKQTFRENSGRANASSGYLLMIRKKNWKYGNVLNT